MELAATAEVKVNAITNVAYVRGRGRLPGDVGSEVLDVLGDVCRVVVCDLTGLATSDASSIVRALTPAACYLHAWHGTAMVVYVSDTALRRTLSQTLVDEHLLVPGSLGTGTSQAQEAMPRLHSVTALLPPWTSAARQARRVAVRALADWQVDNLSDATALVASELVTNAIVHAQTPLQLTMVRAGDQVRLAVRDRGGGRAAGATSVSDTSLNGRGLALVEAFTNGWGVLPARRCGKTVWAVLESSQGRSSLRRSA